MRENPINNQNPRNVGSYYGQAFTGEEDNDTIAAGINDRKNKYLIETKVLRRQWLINSAMARGHQFSYLHRTQDRLINLQELPGRKQVQVDLIKPWKEHMIASLTRAMPKFEAIPETTDSSSISGARMGTSLLDYYWDTWRFITQYITICNGMMDFGNMFVYLNYMEDGSHYRSKPIIDANTGQPVFDNDDNPMQEKTPIGDIVPTLVNPQNIIVPFDGNMDLDDKPWIALYQRRSMDYFEMTYGDAGKAVKPENSYSISTDGDEYNLERISDPRNYSTDIRRMEYANEVVYFQKPSDKNPDGMVVVMANNKILSRSKWPYSKLVGVYPIEHFHLRREAGEFFARSWVEPQISPQRLYNLLWSILAENVDDNAHQKLLVPNHCLDEDPSDITEILHYTGSQAPEYLQLSDMPSYYQNAFAMIEMKMRDLQNYHGASQGGAVSGVRSDVHAQNLQDQDLLPLSVVDELMRSSFERMGEKILTIAAEKLTEERVISFTGKGSRLQYADFKGEMLGDTRRVKVRMSELWMRSRGMTRQTILNMFQMGGITDQYGNPDATKLVQLMEFDVPESMNEELRVHSEQAYLENDRMYRGEQPPVTPWQNQKLHLNIHDAEMNSTEFMELYEKGMGDDPQAKASVEQFMIHKGQHEALFAQAMSGLAPPPEEQNNQSQAGAEAKRPQQTATPPKEEE